MISISVSLELVLLILANALILAGIYYRFESKIALAKEDGVITWNEAIDIFRDFVHDDDVESVITKINDDRLHDAFTLARNVTLEEE